jgi:hypothetical protein
MEIISVAGDGRRIYKDKGHKGKNCERENTSTNKFQTQVPTSQ